MSITRAPLLDPPPRTPDRPDAPSSTATSIIDRAALRDRLLAQAHLFDDPAAYAAGVEDALSAAEGLVPVA